MKTIASAFLSVLMSVVWADVEFGNLSQQFVSAETVFTAQTQKQVEFPGDVGTPIFWLDCASTNGWTFADDGGVLKLPSKVPGSTRYLTSDKNDPNFENFSWKCWGWPKCTTPANQHWVKAPTLTSPAAGLAGHGVLDFGAQGSEIGLVFDLWRPDESCAWSNTLSNIGSVFAVYDSSRGGGCFLGGGYGKNQSGYCWHRGNNNADGSASCHFYCDTVFVSHAFDSVRGCDMRHFGFPAPNNCVGFSGDWEMLTLCPDNGSAKQDATGIGLGDTRPYDTDRWSAASGGLRLAEMIFFDRVLADAEVLKVEAYLRTKWLTKPAGWNGNAVLAAVNEWALENSATLPGWLFAVINGALLLSAMVAGLITKLLAIPGVNEWLRKGNFRSLLAPDNEPSLAAKAEVDVAAGPPPAL